MLTVKQQKIVDECVRAAFEKVDTEKYWRHAAAISQEGKDRYVSM
jgi:hypothetical protein